MRISDWSSDVCSSDLFEILRHLAELLVRLEVDPLGAAPIEEIVDVGTAPGPRDFRVDRTEVEAERARLVLVDLDLQLRCVLQAARADLCNALVASGAAQQLVTPGEQLPVAPVGLFDSPRSHKRRVGQSFVSTASSRRS